MFIGQLYLNKSGGRKTSQGKSHKNLINICEKLLKYEQTLKKSKPQEKLIEYLASTYCPSIDKTKNVIYRHTCGSTLKKINF